MPTYVYVNEQDETDVVEKTYPISKFRRRRRIDGKWYVVSAALQQDLARRCAEASRKKKIKPRGYPYYSDAMSVHPAQVAEAQRAYREAGLPSQDFDSMGRVRVTSRGHRHQLMKARGFVDLNSYTGH